MYYILLSSKSIDRIKKSRFHTDKVTTHKDDGSIGVWGNFEYADIWLITIVMTVSGMTTALIAGIIVALSTYAVQSINYHNPIRQILTATSLRSSAWTRCATARAILENSNTGRARILIFHLQGHVSCFKLLTSKYSCFM